MCQRTPLLYAFSCGKVCMVNDYLYLCNVSPRQASQRCSNVRGVFCLYAFSNRYNL